MVTYTNAKPAAQRALGLVLGGTLVVSLATGLGAWHFGGHAEIGHLVSSTVQQPPAASVSSRTASAADLASVRALRAMAGVAAPVLSLGAVVGLDTLLTDGSGNAVSAVLTAADLASLRALGAVAGLPPDSLTLVDLR